MTRTRRRSKEDKGSASRPEPIPSEAPGGDRSDGRLHARSVGDRFLGTRVILCIILVVAAVAVYAASLSNGFVLDDVSQVVSNHLAHSLANIRYFFEGGTFPTGGRERLGGIYYRPLMSTSFALVYGLFGSAPFYFHLYQLAIHVVNGVLVFLLLDAWLARVVPRGAPAPRVAQFLPFALALVFVVHPVNVEAVAYVSAVHEVQCVMFGLAALMVLESSRGARHDPWWRRLVVALLLLLSLLSKETGAVVVVITLLYLACLDRTRLRAFAPPIVVTVGLYAFLRLWVAGIPIVTPHNASSLIQASLGERLLSAPKILYSYLSGFVFPKDLTVSQHWLVKSPTAQEFWVPLAVVLAVAGLLGYILYRRRPGRGDESTAVFVFFLGWVAVSLGLLIHIVPLDFTVADRWMYLPMIGMLGLLGCVLKMYLPEALWKRPALLGTIAILIVAGLGARAVVRTLDWKDALTLYSHDIPRADDSFDLQVNLASELIKAGRLAEAKPHLLRGYELAPDSPYVLHDMGVMYYMEKDVATAESFFLRAIAKDGNYIVYADYLTILLEQKRLQEAKDFLERQALPRFPYNVEFRNLHARLTATLGGPRR